MDIEGEIYNPVFYERIPVDYLKAADGSTIDAAYLEAHLQGNVRWLDKDGNDVSADRLRGMKLQVTQVPYSEAPQYAADTGGMMNYTSTQMGYTPTRRGKPFADMNPTTDGVSEQTEFALFRIEWVADPTAEESGSVVPPGREEVSPVDLVVPGTTCVEVGDTIELWFDVTAAIDGLPQVYNVLSAQSSGTTGK